MRLTSFNYRKGFLYLLWYFVSKLETISVQIGCKQLRKTCQEDLNSNAGTSSTHQLQLSFGRNATLFFKQKLLLKLACG